MVIKVYLKGIPKGYGSLDKLISFAELPFDKKLSPEGGSLDIRNYPVIVRRCGDKEFSISEIPVISENSGDVGIRITQGKITFLDNGFQISRRNPDGTNVILTPRTAKIEPDVNDYIDSLEMGKSLFAPLDWGRYVLNEIVGPDRMIVFDEGIELYSQVECKESKGSDSVNLSEKLIFMRKSISQSEAAALTGKAIISLKNRYGDKVMADEINFDPRELLKWYLLDPPVSEKNPALPPEQITKNWGFTGKPDDERLKEYVGSDEPFKISRPFKDKMYKLDELTEIDLIQSAGATEEDLKKFIGVMNLKLTPKGYISGKIMRENFDKLKLFMYERK